MVLKNLFLLFILIGNICFAQKKSALNTDTTKIITIKGIIEKGVEAGCVILKTNDKKIYSLLNIQTSVKPGTCLKVKGYIKQNVVTICMQGTPFYAVSYCPCNKKRKPKYQRELPKEKVNKEN